MADLRLFGQNEGALYQGGSGNDTVQINTGAISASTLQGLAGNDVIFLGNETNTQKIIYSGGQGSAGQSTAAAGTAGFVVSGFFETAGVIANGQFATAALISAGTSTSYTIQSLVTTGISGIATSTINGNAGNDSVFLGDQLRSFQGAFVGGGAGNDYVGSFNSGGAITGRMNAELTASTINGGEGNDTVWVNFSGQSAKDFVINGNAGADSVRFSSVSAGVRSGLIGGGAGNDTINASFRSGSAFSINGGAGNDTITFDNDGALAKSLIQGDTTLAQSGDDTIQVSLDGAASSVTIQGLGGNDSIVINTASGGGANLVAGNAGKDTIVFSAGAGQVDDISGWTVNGGAGNDIVTLSSYSAGAVVSSIFNGGAGKDTITLGVSTTGSAGASGVSVYGGAGADKLTNNMMGVGGGIGTFGYSAYTDSTISAMDTVTFNTAAVSAGTTYGSANVILSFAQGGIAAISGKAASGGAVSASGGFIVWSGYSDNSLTSRVSAIDAAYATTGNIAVFTTNETTRYVFVQGGTNDTVIQLSDEDDLTAGKGSIHVTGGTAVGFAF